MSLDLVPEIVYPYFSTHTLQINIPGMVEDHGLIRSLYIWSIMAFRRPLQFSIAQHSNNFHCCVCCTIFYFHPDSSKLHFCNTLVIHDTL